MCLVHEQPSEAWSSLAAVVRAEKSSIMEHGGDKQFVKINNKAEFRARFSLNHHYDVVSYFLEEGEGVLNDFA